MRFVFLFLFINTIMIGYAQMYDNNWVMGDPVNAVLNFENGTVDSITSAKSSKFWNASSTISDKMGVFLLFSNGVVVKNKNGDVIENGDNFKFGYYDTILYLPMVPYLQGVYFLPMPGSDSLYYYFHTASVDTSFYQASRLFYSVIDVTANNGVGSVVSQNNLLIDTFITDAMMGICKHANGTDWWLLKPRYETNTYFRFLVRSNGVVEGPFTQSIGLAFNDPDWKGQMVFSVDGNKLVCGIGLGPSQVFDFDRCTGLLSNPRTFSAIDGSYIVGGIGCSFSPNGRYIYATMDSFKLYQLDTYSPNLNNSKVLLDNGNKGNFNKMFYHQLTPKGEIYIAGHGAPTPISVIHFPDSAGVACGLDTFSFNPFFSIRTFGMPCFPHYRTPPSTAYAAEAGRDTTVCDSLLQLSVGIPLGAPAVDSVVYAWSSPNDANFGGSAQAQIIVQPTTSAMYVLHIQDTSTAPKYSCTERWDTVYVNVTSNCFTSNPKSPKGDLNSQIQVSPNPAKDFFFVETELNGGELSVRDVEGRVVQKLEMRNQRLEIRCSGWARGVYLVTMKDKNGEQWNRKVVVE